MTISATGLLNEKHIKYIYILHFRLWHNVNEDKKQKNQNPRSLNSGRKPLTSFKGHYQI